MASLNAMIWTLWLAGTIMLVAGLAGVVRMKLGRGPSEALHVVDERPQVAPRLNQVTQDRAREAAARLLEMLRSHGGGSTNCDKWDADDVSGSLEYARPHTDEWPVVQVVSQPSRLPADRS